MWVNAIVMCDGHKGTDLDGAQMQHMKRYEAKIDVIYTFVERW